VTTLNIREAVREDMEQLLELYTQLNENDMPASGRRLEEQ